MNIIIIPSWYPSEESPLCGIFFKEQAYLFAKKYPAINIHVLYVQNVPFRLNINSTVVTKQNKNFYEHVVNFCQILPGRYESFDKFNNLLRLKKYKKLFSLFLSKYGQVDLIHAQCMYSGGYFAQIFSKELEVPYIVQEHSSKLFFYDNNNFPIKFKNILKNSSGVYAVSKHAASKLQSISNTTVMVLPNFIEDKEYLPTPNSLNRRFKFLSVALLNQNKGIDILLYAFNKLVNEYDISAELTIVGNGPELDKLKILSKVLNISDYINFIGSVPRCEIVKYYQSCNCFVLPSKFETFGVVYLEALACGRPIIATRCGGPEDIVNSINGLMVDVDDILSLADAMMVLVKDFDQYNYRSIRIDYEIRFGSDVVLEKIFNIYNKLC